MSEASWVPRLITTINPAQDAAGATIVTSGDLQVDPNSHSTPITSAFTVSTALTALEPSKRVWTLTSLWTHRTRPQVTLKTAKAAVFNSAHTHPLVLKKRKEEERTDPKQRS